MPTMADWDRDIAKMSDGKLQEIERKLAAIGEIDWPRFNQVFWKEEMLQLLHTFVTNEIQARETRILREKERIEREAKQAREEKEFQAEMTEHKKRMAELDEMIRARKAREQVQVVTA